MVGKPGKEEYLYSRGSDSEGLKLVSRVVEMRPVFKIKSWSMVELDLVTPSHYCQQTRE